MSQQTLQLSEIAKAIYTINRHAKTAPEPQHLYFMKKEAIKRLLHKKQAVKVGLHFSDHPKFSNQHSTLLIRVKDYYFHVLPEKEDFKSLDHLGTLDKRYHNPRTKMSLSQAKRIIYRYIDWYPKKKTAPKKKKHYISPYHTPSSLGRMDWPKQNAYRRY